MSEISDYARRAGDTFAELVATVERLRNPGGCPWDAEQTHLSLRQHLLEETYELLDAIDSEISDDVEEELGDVLAQTIFHTDIAHRESRFDAATSIEKVTEKLIRRHPHVFGDAEQLTDPEEVIDRWHRYFPDAPVERIPDAGYYLQEERPDRVVAGIRRVLERV